MSAVITDLRAWKASSQGGSLSSQGRAEGDGRGMKEGSVEEAASREVLGAGATYFSPATPSKSVQRIDYERIYVLDDERKVLGEYVLRDDCPIELGDLQRAIPLSG